MRVSGRFVRVFQWIAPVLMPFLVVFGHGALGAPMGWMAVIGMFISPFVIVAMYLLPVIVVFDRDARALRGTRIGYNAASWTMWGAMLGVMLSLPDGGDGPPFGSVLTTWGMNSDLGDAVAVVSIIAVVVSWIAALVLAIIGVVVSRTAR